MVKQFKQIQEKHAQTKGRTGSIDWSVSQAATGIANRQAVFLRLKLSLGDNKSRNEKPWNTNQRPTISRPEHIEELTSQGCRRNLEASHVLPWHHIR